MWVSKKKWKSMEKRIADIEKQVQQQPLEIFRILCGQWHKQMTGLALSSCSTDVIKKFH